MFGSRKTGLGQGPGDLGVEGVPTTEAEQQALSRRRFLAGSAALLSGGALVAAIPGVAEAHTTGSPSDIDILNFALTLEHLEATFYNEGLEIFADNLDDLALQAITTIRDHENEHVDTFKKVIRSIGGTPVGPATYNFERTAFTSVDKFLSVAALLENTGVSAYDGAIAHIQSSQTSPQGALLTGGAQTATVEARHAAIVNLIIGDGPFPNTFDPPVSPREIFDSAKAFISTPLSAPYPPYRTLGAFRNLLPNFVIGGIPVNGL